MRNGRHSDRTQVFGPVHVTGLVRWRVYRIGRRGGQRRNRICHPARRQAAGLQEPLRRLDHGRIAHQERMQRGDGQKVGGPRQSSRTHGHCPVVVPGDPGVVTGGRPFPTGNHGERKRWRWQPRNESARVFNQLLPGGSVDRLEQPVIFQHVGKVCPLVRHPEHHHSPDSWIVPRRQ
jgi:hypothetical protein